MRIARRTIVPLLALLAIHPGVVSAYEPPRRVVEAVSSRVALQRELSSWLEDAVRGVAFPWRVLVSVQVLTKDDRKEIVKRESQPGAEMKLGATKSVKLPGLPLVNKPVAGFGAPDIQVKVPGKTTVQVQHEFESSVERIVVDLFVESGMPKRQMDRLQEAAAALAGLDLGRGDAVRVTPLSGPAASPPAPPLPFHREHASVLLVCATVLTSSLLLAVALGAGRARTPGGGTSHVLASLEAPAGKPTPDGDPGTLGGQATTDATPSAVPPAFAALVNASPDEQVEVLAALDPAVAATILDQAAFSSETITGLLDRLTPDRQLAVALLLARPRVVERSALEKMEALVASAVERVHSRVRIGSEARSADFLMLAPPPVQQQILRLLAAEDEALAKAIRARMVLFEDLERLPAAAVRQIVTTVDSETSALALRGAPAPLRKHVLAAVSGRLRAVLAAEEASVAARSEADVERARKTIERVMRRLLVPEPSAPPPA